MFNGIFQYFPLMFTLLSLERLSKLKNESDTELVLVGLFYEYSLGVAGPRGTHEKHKCGVAKAEEQRPK